MAARQSETRLSAAQAEREQIFPSAYEPEIAAIEPVFAALPARELIDAWQKLAQATPQSSAEAVAALEQFSIYLRSPLAQEMLFLRINGAAGPSFLVPGYRYQSGASADTAKLLGFVLEKASAHPSTALINFAVQILSTERQDRRLIEAAAQALDAAAKAIPDETSLACVEQIRKEILLAADSYELSHAYVRAQQFIGWVTGKDREELGRDAASKALQHYRECLISKEPNPLADPHRGLLQLLGEIASEGCLTALHDIADEKIRIIPSSYDSRAAQIFGIAAIALPCLPASVGIAVACLPAAVSAVAGSGMLLGAAIGSLIFGVRLGDWLWSSTHLKDQYPAMRDAAREVIEKLPRK